MTAGRDSAALTALRAVSPALARLDPSGDPTQTATALRETGNGVEQVLRALAGGLALEGTALVRELRQRELLTLAQAHLVVELFAARDRASQPGYHTTAADVETARSAVHEVEHLAGMPPDATPRHTPEVVRETAAAAALALPVADRSPEPRRTWLMWGIGAVVVAGLALAAVMVVRGRSADSLPPGVREGADLMVQGRRDEAAARLTQASLDNPSSAAPHVYLARLARDRADISTARAELVRALRLEPRNALAQREMGSLLLATGETELATKFYARAIDEDPKDRVAMGLLACALARLGRPDEAARWLSRAGEGEWSACVRSPGP